MIGKLFSQGLIGIAVVALSALAWSVARSAEPLPMTSDHAVVESRSSQDAGRPMEGVL